MAPLMAATVLGSSVFLMFFFCFLFLKQDQFCQGWTAEHSAEHTTNLLPDFDYLVILLDIVVGRSRSSGLTLQDAQTEEASQRARKASSARIKNAVA